MLSSLRAIRVRVTAVTALCACAIAVGAPAVAFAYHAATKRETRAIRAAILADRQGLYIECLGNDRLGFRKAYISSANPRYALGGVVDNSCTYSFGYFLHRPSRRSERWHVLGALPDSLELCSQFRKFLPEAVIRDFRISGQMGTAGPIGRC